MKRNYSIWLLFPLLFIWGCSVNPKEQNLIGKISLKNWENSNYWNEKSFREFSIDSNKLNLFKSIFDKKEFSIIIFASVYCDECLENIPKIDKILKFANIQNEKIFFYGLDEYTSEPTETYKRYRIKSTPAVFFEKNNSRILIENKGNWLDNFIDAAEKI